jgi:hypothetical protein
MLVLLLLALLPAGTAVAKVGQPDVVRVSRPSEQRAYPQARTEFWELSAVNPRTREALLIELYRGEDFPSVSLSYAKAGDPQHLDLHPDQAFVGGDRRGARFTGPQGTSTAAWRGRRVQVDVSDPQASAHVVLRGRPGPFAGRWHLGPGMRYPEERAESVVVSYDVPIGAGRLGGTVTLDGRRIQLDGWRGSWEHVWGSFMARDHNWKFWDAYTVHTRGGAAWIAFGLNRQDTVTGPGARDGQWLGVLARVGRRGTRVCRPGVHRREWSASPVFRDDPVPHRMQARCRGLRARFTEPLDATWLRANAYGFEQHSAQPAFAGGGFGIARHLSHTGG